MSATSLFDTTSPNFLTLIPAVHTIPGVEQFTYAVDASSNLRPGDVLRVPFRNRQRPALVVKVAPTTAFTGTLITLPHPKTLISFPASLLTLLEDAAQQSFVSRPTIFASWIREIPKKYQANLAQEARPSQIEFPMREQRFLVDRFHSKRGLLAEARTCSGRTLILTPWQHRADAVGAALHANVLHANLAPTTAWKSVAEFVAQPSALLVATRIGAWLACVADTVLMDEPENDDYKQDELSPRLDARRIVARAADLRPQMNVLSFATTPRLRSPLRAEPSASFLDPHLTREAWTARSRSPVDCLSPRSINLIEETLAGGRAALVIHPIRGVRARLACRDCGWTAICAFCSFHLSQTGASAICRRCGRHDRIPEACIACGGTDLSRGLPGKERLSAQCASAFKTDRVRVVDLMEFDAWCCQRIRHHPTPIQSPGLILITDLALLGGASEDIRRKERQAIAFRRIAAEALSLSSHLHVQGSQELLDVCPTWLTPEGLHALWQMELDERLAFGYPPAVPFAKLLIDGTETDAAKIARELRESIPRAWTVRGPWIVPYRSYTRTPRHVLHVSAPDDVDRTALARALEPFKTRARIDLDPMTFFS